MERQRIPNSLIEVRFLGASQSNKDLLHRDTVTGGFQRNGDFIRANGLLV